MGDDDDALCRAAANAFSLRMPERTHSPKSTRAPADSDDDDNDEDALCRAAANAFSLRMPERTHSPKRDSSSTMADRRWSYDAGLPLAAPIAGSDERRSKKNS